MKTPLEHMVKIRPIREVDVPLLKDAAERDQHGVLSPTHVLTKNGEFIGYLSLAGMPMVSAWMHTKEVHGRDTLQVIGFAENVVVNNGAISMAVPVPKRSPMHDQMAKLGYTPVDEVTLFVKVLV
jgi:hypothetical protein